MLHKALKKTASVDIPLKCGPWKARPCISPLTLQDLGLSFTVERDWHQPSSKNWGWGRCFLWPKHLYISCQLPFHYSPLGTDSHLFRMLDFTKLMRLDQTHLHLLTESRDSWTSCKSCTPNRMSRHCSTDLFAGKATLVLRPVEQHQHFPSPLQTPHWHHHILARASFVTVSYWHLTDTYCHLKMCSPFFSFVFSYEACRLQEELLLAPWAAWHSAWSHFFSFSLLHQCKSASSLQASDFPSHWYCLLI